MNEQMNKCIHKLSPRTPEGRGFVEPSHAEGRFSGNGENLAQHLSFSESLGVSLPTQSNMWLDCHG